MSTLPEETGRNKPVVVTPAAVHLHVDVHPVRIAVSQDPTKKGARARLRGAPGGRGAPEGSQLWPEFPKDFLATVGVVARTLIAQGRSPTEDSVAEFFGRSSDPQHPRTSARQLRRWKTEAGYARWEDLLRAAGVALKS